MSIARQLQQIISDLPDSVTLVAVSKTKPVSDLLEAYQAGQRIFGENKIQEMVDKYEALPKDIQWHMIGHVQTNKVKYMAPFVALIHGVDSLKLLKEIDKQGAKHNRILDCLLQVHIASEETKFGFDAEEIQNVLDTLEKEPLHNICIKGLMGMASFTEDQGQVAQEFRNLKQLFDAISQRPKTRHFQPEVLSMGMSGDYKIAIEQGSTMVRIGSTIFGQRNVGLTQ